jgi:hypothetical protein
MVMDVPHSLQDEDLQIQIWEDHVTQNQLWLLERTDVPTANGPGNCYKIRSAVPGLVLDCEGGVSRNGTRIIQYRDTGNDNQLWSLVSTGGVFKIMGFRGQGGGQGFVIDVPSPNLASGTGIQLWQSDNGRQQHWQIIASVVD